MKTNTLIDILSAVIITLCLPYDLGIHLIEAVEATWIDIKEQWRSRLAYYDQHGVTRRSRDYQER